MTYFLCPQTLETGMTVSLAGEEARHLLQSRRIKPGERFALQDSRGRRFQAEMIAPPRHGGGTTANARVLAPLPVPEPPPLAVRLVQAAVKDKAAEWLIQKATELGVAEIRFFHARYSTVGRRALEAPGQLARWERIAWEACKQCDRAAPPSIRAWPTLEAALEPAHRQGVLWLLHPESTLEASRALEAARGGDPAAEARLVVGPEGGLAEEELETALHAGFAPVRLGANLLRAETAALAACALLLFGLAAPRMGTAAGRD